MHLLAAFIDAHFAGHCYRLAKEQGLDAPALNNDKALIRSLFRGPTVRDAAPSSVNPQ